VDASNGLEIAVVGMAASFPGADSVAAYWDLVVNGREAIARFSDEQLAAAGVPESQRRDPGYVAAGAVLAGGEEFDAEFFGYTPRDATILDPQHRVFLQCAWHALEDAGYAAHPERHLVGVYAGTSMSTYLINHLLPNAGLMRDLSGHEVLLSNDKDSLASQAAYHMNLTGPAVGVQTACSTSLVAVHLACQALLARDCELALSGGVTLSTPQTEGYRFQEGGILSPDGRCRPFDAAAHGTVGGNGVGVVVLKRLADALRDGDTIHAVIKGTAINNDGSAKVGFSAPSVTGQAAVIRSALNVAEVDPATIGYVEAHGTATALGDPIEVAALTEAYRSGTDRRGYCALGSVKALIGHTDTAAGVAGLIKAVLAVRHGVIPPSPYLSTPNPALQLDDTPFYLNRDPLAWPQVLSPRRAGVTALGMGGTNAHVIVEQPPAREPAAAAGGGPHLLLLSARSAEALAAARADLAGHLADGPPTPLADVAYTLRVGRRAFAHRSAVVCGDREQALSALCAEGGGTRRWDGVCPAEGREVVALFPGQGAQYPGMAAGLYRHQPVFRHHLDECAALLRPHLDAGLVELLHADEQTSVLHQTRYTQPALFAVEYALAMLWRHWGVWPVAMLGHSVGEYVAACLAGVIDLPDALALVAARGRLMQGLPGGAMLAVGAGAETVADLLAPGLSLAASNAPEFCTVSGPGADIDVLVEKLAAAGVPCRRLHTSHAFHSAMMDPILERFGEVVAGVALRPPAVPFVSCVTGAPISAEQATDPGYWVSQLRQPVRFAEGLAALLVQPRRILLEVGPNTTLSTLARQQDLAGGGHTVVGCMRHPRDEQPDGVLLAGALGRMWLAGASLNLAATGAAGRRVPLPGYPFESKRYWCELPVAQAAAAPVRPEPALADAVAVHAVPVDAVPVDATLADAVPVDAASRAGAAGPIESGGDTVEVICAVWSQLLGVAEVSEGDNFFDLGGHSLLAVQVAARLQESLDVQLSAASLFEAPTAADLARHVDAQRAATEVSDEELIAAMEGLPDDQLHVDLRWLREVGGRQGS
jgi:acyl transferase domain-containing protein